MSAQSQGSAAGTEEVSSASLVDELYRLVTNIVIKHSSSLLHAAETAEKKTAAQHFVADLQKVHGAGEQLLRMTQDFFLSGRDVQKKAEAITLTSTQRHDLRTPVNAIIGYSEMMLEDAEDDNSAEFFSRLEELLQAGRRALVVINQLIAYSRQNETGSPSGIPEILQDGEAEHSSLLHEISTFHSEAKKRKKTAENVPYSGWLLVVDDKESNRDILSRQLSREGYIVDQAENGLQALDMMRENNYDLVLLDILMPEMNGYQVLSQATKDEWLQHIPVLMISALDEIDIVVRCIEMGALDYLQKPFNPIILSAKIASHLERKKLRDREQAYLQQLQQEQENSERLLLNILPKPIADRLKHGERTIADSFPEVTILFADLVRFTEMSKAIPPSEVVNKLNDIFLAFDILVELYGLEKIKTIGDAYMLAGGLPLPQADHAESVAEIAIDMLDAIGRLNNQNHSDLSIRIGIHTGPVVAGIIGKNKFNYDLWGEAVNVASRMESQSESGRIQVSAATYDLLKGKFHLEKRGTVKIKGMGDMVTYWLLGRL